MNKLKEFVANNDVDFTKNLISKDDLNEILARNGYSFGKQLKEYICSYGYLGFGAYELYGINSRQKDKSDMLTQTAYLRKYFPESKVFVALESLGDGDYALINDKDEVFIFSTEMKTLESTGKNLEEYIISRFSQ